MLSILKEKLLFYVMEHNPDLVIGMQRDYTFGQYLDDKIATVKPMLDQLSADGRPSYIIEEICLNAMTEQLRPSRFQYLRSILETEFTEDFYRFEVLGILNYEVINLLESCKEIFDVFGFSEDNEDDRHMRYAIIGQVHEYLL